MKTADGRLYVVAGAARSGKTAWVKKHVAAQGARRVWAWDPEDQWAQLKGWKKVTTRTELMALAQKSGPQKVAFVTGGKLAEEFDFWAQCVMFAGRYVEPLSAIAEELSDVSSPSKATTHWGILIRRGLKRGINIYAISQRWSEADKTAFGNASDYVMFRQSSGDDVAYIARKTSANFDQINRLKPLEFVLKNSYTGEFSGGKLKF